MKRFLLISLLALFVSCGDDDCDCGIIEATDVDYDIDEGYTYFIDLRDNCTDNIENNIQVTENIWINYFVGEELCDIENIRLD